MRNNVRKNLKALTDRIVGPMLEKSVTQAMIVGGMYADLLTPIDTGHLLRSRFREVKPATNGWIGQYGYTAAYASAVHSMSGKLKGKPRGDFGKTKDGQSFGGGTGVGNYWDPNAEPEFLVKGFERDGLQAIRMILKKGMSI